MPREAWVGSTSYPGCALLILWLASLPVTLLAAWEGWWTVLIISGLVSLLGMAYFRDTWIGGGDRE